MEMIGQKNERENFKAVTKTAEGLCEPGLNDLGDGWRGHHEEHFVLTPIGDKVNTIFDMHPNLGHESSFGEDVMSLLGQFGTRVACSSEDFQKSLKGL